MIEQTIDGIHFAAGNWPPDSAKPSIIFIHGSGNSNIFWKAQVVGLKDDANIIAIDLPGHGQSGGDGLDTVSGYAGAVESFLDAAEIGKPILSGLSLGGAIVLQMLLDSKGKYSGGILVNSGARLRVLSAIFETIRNHYDSYVSSLATVAASEKTDKALLDDVLEDARQCSPEVVMGDFSACNRFDVMERLGEIEVPVLVLTAEDDRLSPVKYGLYLAEHIGNSSHVNIKDAGHMSPVEKPDEVNDAIRVFLKSL